MHQARTFDFTHANISYATVRVYVIVLTLVTSIGPHICVHIYVSMYAHTRKYLNRWTQKDTEEPLVATTRLQARCARRKIAYTNVLYWPKALDFLRLYELLLPDYANFTREMKARMNEFTNACRATLLNGAPCRVVN